jgi:ABC-type glycerol-3-phosphate transport system substrate-binding protein
MNKHLTRRRFLLGAGAGLSAALLAACQPQVLEVTKVVEKQVTQVIKETVMVAGTPQVVEKVVTATPPPPTPKAVDKGPLTILWTSQVALVKTFQEFSDNEFTPANNGAKVDIIIAPDGEFPQKILSGIASGNPPDIFRAVNHMNFGQFALGDVVLALDDLIARDGYEKHLSTFLPHSLDTGKLKGKQYGIPFGAHPGPWSLFYNKTELAKKGFKLDNLKWAWDDYAQIAKAMTDSANKVWGSWIRCNTAGYVVGTRSMGSDIIDETGTKSLINSDGSRRWWEFTYKMINELQASPKPSDVPSWDAPFTAQKIMMSNDNGYRESFLRETVKDFEWDIWVTPSEGNLPRGSLNADLCPITAASKHVDLAWNWVKGILTVEQGIKRVKEARHIPLTIEAAMLPKGEEISPQYEFYIKQWLANPPLPMNIPANGRITEVYTTILNAGFGPAWLKTQPLDTVIKSIHDQIQLALEKPAL